jgi:hypothetical protein
VRDGRSGETAEFGFAAVDTVPVLEEGEEDREVGDEDGEEGFAEGPGAG